MGVACWVGAPSTSRPASYAARHHLRKWIPLSTLPATRSPVGAQSFALRFFLRGHQRTHSWVQSTERRRKALVLVVLLVTINGVVAAFHLTLLIDRFTKRGDSYETHN